MGLLSINGLAIYKATIRLPRVGVWNADLLVDSLTSLSGPATIATQDGAFSLQGTAFREGIFAGTLSMRVIGGAGGLGTAPGGLGSVLPPKFYQGSTIRLILTDILTTCGETLSPTSDANVLNTVLQKWTRTRGTGKQAIARLFDNIATSWRILADGTFWVGTDTYPAAPNTQFDIVERYFGEGRIVIGSQQPFVMPGTLLTINISGTAGVENVSNVVHEVRDDFIRSEVWFERSGVQS